MSQCCDLKSAFFSISMVLYDRVDDGNPPLSVCSVIAKLKVNAIDVNLAWYSVSILAT